MRVNSRQPFVLGGQSVSKCIVTCFWRSEEVKSLLLYLGPASAAVTYNFSPEIACLQISANIISLQTSMTVLKKKHTLMLFFFFFFLFLLATQINPFVVLLSVTECSTDEEISSTVPIAVAAALAGLAIIAFAVYQIGSRRKQKNLMSI